MERISRKKFTSRCFLILLINILAALVIYPTENFTLNSFETLFIIFSLILDIVLFVNVVGRLKDINKSPELSLLFFLPFINLILLIILCLVDGTIGDNQYGKDPLKRITINQLEERIKESEFYKDDNLEVADLKTKLNTLESSKGVLNDDEYNHSKIRFENLIENYNLISKKEIEFNDKVISIKRLLTDQIITENEYNDKLNSLITEYETYFFIDRIMFNNSLSTRFHYIKDCKELAPVPGEKIIRLLLDGEIDFNTWIRKENEEYDSDFNITRLMAYYKFQNVDFSQFLNNNNK